MCLMSVLSYTYTIHSTHVIWIILLLLLNRYIGILYIHLLYTWQSRVVRERPNVILAISQPAVKCIFIDANDIHSRGVFQYSVCLVLLWGERKRHADWFKTIYYYIFITLLYSPTCVTVLTFNTTNRQTSWIRKLLIASVQFNGWTKDDRRVRRNYEPVAIDEKMLHLDRPFFTL